MARLYDKKEASGFTPSEGISSLLARLKEHGVQIAIVSESSSLASTLAIIKLLRVYGLADLFGDIITPVGRSRDEGRLVDGRFIGMTKKSGSIYDILKAFLHEGGVSAAEAVMVGDDPLLDVEHPKLRGFMGIQYAGVVDRGRSKVADYVIDSWEQFPDVY